MSLSGLVRPTIAEIKNRVISGLSSVFDISDNVLPYSPLGALVNAVAGVCFELYGVIDRAVDNTFVQFAKGVHLDRTYIGIIYPRKQGRAETITVTLTNPNNTDFTLLTSQSFYRGAVTLNPTISVLFSPNETKTVTLISSNGSPIPTSGAISTGIFTTVTPVTIFPAILGEDDESYRSRLLSLLRSPLTGNLRNYVEWAKSVPGVVRAWVIAPYIQPNGIRIIIETVGNQSLTLLDTQAYIEQVKTVTSAVTVTQAEYNDINLTVKGLSPTITTALQNAITAELADTIATRANPSSVIRRSWLWDAVANVSGVDYFELYESDGVTELANFTPEQYKLAKLGTVTFTN